MTGSFNNMKTQFLTSVLLVIGFCGTGAEKPSRHPLMESGAVVWTGLDYSMVRMVGAEEFKIPDMIFPGMLEQWNALFIEERIVKVASRLKKRITIDISGVSDRNKAATADRIILKPGANDVITATHITGLDLASQVRSYKLDRTNGLGLVFIVDRFVRKQRSRSHSVESHSGHLENPRTYEGPYGAVYVVFFDIATREVVSAEREIRKAGGSTFRNLVLRRFQWN